MTRRRLQNPKGRSTLEWVGKTPDSVPPPRVVLRILERYERLCHRIGQLIHGKRGVHWDIDHIIALANWTGDGHGNRESNMAPILLKPHKIKTAEDRLKKAARDRSVKKQYGIRNSSYKPLPGGRHDRLKKKIGGGVVDRKTGEQLWPR